MERSKAINLLREILDATTLFDGCCISLTQPDPTSKLSSGYQLYVRTLFDGKAKQSVDPLLKKYSVTIFENLPQHLSIIFQPEDIT
jgi:hypothetical protein